MSKHQYNNSKNSGRKLIIPKDYKASLTLTETEEAIKYIKDNFQKSLSRELNLYRVSAPVIVLNRTGINDYLSGVEKPVSLRIKETGEQAEIVQSLAKWKRVALADYGFKYPEGLYTDMNALRPEEELDNMHSIYVDQWDWEKIIIEDERSLVFLESIVKRIYKAVRKIERMVCRKYPVLGTPVLPEKIHFIHSEDLEDRYPGFTPAERENLICREKKAVFIVGIGAKLKKGLPHDDRAADYDDWITATGRGKKGLNGDIIVWFPTLNCAMELSSMGIRVNRESLLKQLEIKKEKSRKNLYFHKRLLNGTLPLTMGGGIGQSRLCMFYLRKAHIGEVQSCIWPDHMTEKCRKNNIFLL